MSYRDVLAIAPAGESDGHAIAFAQQLAQSSRGHLSVLLVAWRADVPMLVEGMSLAPVWQEQAREAERELETRRQLMDARLRKAYANCTVETLLVTEGEARAKVAQFARCRDLAIIGRPGRDVLGDPHTPLIEGALFGSGRPVVVIPAGWTPRPVGSRIAIGWNSSREAARAINDASPFLASAEHVGVITIGADAAQAPEMHADIEAHLARRGISSEARCVAPSGRSETAAMLDEVAALEADILVMGGYGRSRFAEMVFGGMTREMLKSSTLPLFLSH